MPTFTVRSPDGRTFKVQGPEGSTAADAQAQAQAHLKSQPRTALQNIQGAASSFVDGALPGTSAFIRGTRGVADNAVSSLFGRDTFHPSKSYTQYARQQQDAHADFKADNPGVANAAGWTGFAGSVLALPELKLMKAAKLAPAANAVARGSVPASVIAKAALRRKATAATVNASATGAAYGTAAGALQGEGTDRITNAVQGGVAGGLVGAVASPVTRLAVGGANRNVVDNDMSEEALQAGAHLSRGNWKSAASSFLSGVISGRVGRYGHDVKAELGRLLTETQPANVSEAMKAIQARAEKDASFAANLRNFSGRAGKVGSAQFVGNSGDRTGMYEDDPE